MAHAAAAVAGARAALEEMEAADREGRPYPLVLLDANMPVMDGFDLAAKVQQSPRLAGASIMMLSSGARPGDRARCFELGISAYLTKPVKQSDLMDTIVGVLASRLGGAEGAAAEGGAAAPAGRPAPPRPRGRGQRRQPAGRGGHARARRATRRSSPRTAGRPWRSSSSEAFDLVLMDVQMPEMDGLEATAAIRERERATGGHLPIVAVTAHAMKGDAERCLAAGMDGYVAKPLQPRELEAAIARVLAPGAGAPARRRPPASRRRSRRRGLPAAPRARRRRPQGPGPARPDLPGGLAEAGRAHPQGHPGERRARPALGGPRGQGGGGELRRPVRHGGGRAAAAHGRHRPPRRGGRARSTGWSGRSAGSSRRWPNPRREAGEARAPGRAKAKRR